MDHLRLNAGSDQEGSSKTSTLKLSDEFTMLPGTLVNDPAVMNTLTVSSDYIYTRQYLQRIQHPPKRYQ